MDDGPPMSPPLEDGMRQGPGDTRAVRILVVGTNKAKTCIRTVAVTREAGTGRRVFSGDMAASALSDPAKVALSLVGARMEEIGRCLECPVALKEGQLEGPDVDICIGCRGMATHDEGWGGGLGMCMAIIALAFGKEVCPDVAFAGEVDLLGNVLEVGKIVEKLEGARILRLSKVVIPKSNFLALDREALSPELQTYVSRCVVPVSNILEAMPHGIVGELKGMGVYKELCRLAHRLTLLVWSILCQAVSVVPGCG